LGGLGQFAAWGAWQAGWVAGGLALTPLALVPFFAFAAMAERPRAGGRVHRPLEAVPGLPPMTLRRRDLNGARVWPGEDGGLELELPRVYPPVWRGLRSRSVRLRGEPAERLLEKALVIRNWQGGGADSIGQAHALRTGAGSFDALLRLPLRRNRVAIERPLHLGIEYAHLRQMHSTPPQRASDGTGLLPVELLALEMALHEERERRALEGELVLLQSAWREAEEIAGIADRLALDPGPGR
jgi:hypothetical protein